MDNEWTIRPKIGFGLISFGMTVEGVAGVSSVYGPLDTVTEDADLSAGLDDTFALFSQFATEEDLAAVRAAVEEKAGQQGRQEIYNGGRVFVMYEAGRVASVMTSVRENRTNLNDTLLFDLPAVDALKLLERANGAPGRYRSTGAAFDNIAVTTDAFSIVTRGQVTPLAASDERFAERTIEAQADAYNPPEEAESWIIHSFL
ncbi:hypothetical protein [Rhizobium terrae]|uniref:hypothetical protein n=1 Tax=Rhizobium terrae TaxID=2171756 RepID=UPI000E3DE87E|nr:hypothetical protein [Rhizobium terrae]